MNYLFWGIIIIVLTVIEILTINLVTIWFVLGGILAFIVSLFLDNFIIELIVFIVSSSIFIIFTKPILDRTLKFKKIDTNYDSLIGKECIVIENIDNLNNKGGVKINGIDWSARSKTNEEIILKGDIVKVIEISGVKVIVEKNYKEMS